MYQEKVLNTDTFDSESDIILSNADEKLQYAASKRDTRERSLTEKGRLYQLGLNQRKRTALQKEIQNHISLMETLVTNNDPRKLKYEYNKLEDMFKDYMKTHGMCQTLIGSSYEEDTKEIERFDRHIYKSRKRFNSWLSEVEKHNVEMKDETRSKTKSNSSKLSNSKKSSSSGLSSVKIQIKEEKARLAELEIEAVYIEKQKLADLETLELQRKSNQLKIEMEMAKAKAK